MSYNCLIRNFILGKLGKFPLMESQSAKKHIFSHRLPSVGFPPNIHIAWNFLRSQNQKSFLASLFRLNLSFNTNPNVSHHWTQVSLQKKTERDFEERTQQIEWPQKTNVVCGVPYWNPPGNCGKVKLKKLFLLRKKCDEPGGHWGRYLAIWSVYIVYYAFVAIPIQDRLLMRWCMLLLGVPMSPSQFWLPHNLRCKNHAKGVLHRLADPGEEAA